jgi:dihydroneopterin aldolase
MTDVIRIRNLIVTTRIGVTPEERAAPRPLVVNIDIHTDTSTAGATDELGDTIDYGRATMAVAEYLRGAETNLLERAAEQIADLIFGYPGVDGVTVEVAKEDPPIDEDVASVAVRIERTGRRGGVG